MSTLPSVVTGLFTLLAGFGGVSLTQRHTRIRGVDERRDTSLSGRTPARTLARERTRAELLAQAAGAPVATEADTFGALDSRGSGGGRGWRRHCAP